MKDTGRAGTIAAGDEGDGTPVCTVAFDPTLDELIGGIAPLQSGRTVRCRRRGISPAPPAS
jgi:hypothetical protein